MALNLSTLTSSATSGDVLAEVLTTADFLEPCPVLRNLARGSQKGGDAKQTVGTQQPKALPLIDGKGYCYLPATTGNAPAVTFPTIGASDDFVLEMDVYLVNAAEFHIASAPNTASRFLVSAGKFYHGSTNTSLTSSLSTGVSTLKIERASGTITLKQNDQLKASASFSSSVALTFLSHNGQFTSSVPPLNGYIQKTTLSIGGTEQLDVDFTATNVRHGDTKFKCATGQVVTINKAGNDPATVIKKSVLRFDGADDFMDGLLNQTVTGGYMFASFSVLGDGGDSFARILGLNSSGSVDSGPGGVAFRRNGTSQDWTIRYNQNNIVTHSDFFDDDRGDYLLEAKVLTGSQKSRVNNADLKTGTVNVQLSAEEFTVGSYTNANSGFISIDLEFLALFPSLTDAQADDVRKYINNRNNVFLRHDTDGYYFFDPQALTDGDLNSTTKKLTGLWDGRIVGSDIGDASFIASQGTGDDQPTSDKYTLNFADNTDHLTITNPNQAGWQVVGTSLGTFAYRVNNTAVTELNLLGNLGNASYRKAGDLYGVILLPESATGADIEEARKLLIDRGASDGATGNFFAAWFTRTDIVDFKHLNTTGVTNAESAWSFNNFSAFPALDLSNCTTFSNAWKNCSNLTSFPAGAKLGTEANNVNFVQAWRSSGLTSFNTPLPTAINLSSAFQDCTQLTEIGQLQTANVTNWYYTFYNCNALSQLPILDTSNGTEFFGTWRGCSLLTQFPVLDCNRAIRFSWTWEGCSSLEDFPSGFFDNWNPSSISNGAFGTTWDGCVALTAQSVENILTSIDASNQHGTDDGTSTGNPLADAGIDIDYDGTTLSAATNSAVTSLKAKGWSIIVNNVTL